ncbi:MAG TPA: amino acid adenylation domain-containing protein [Pyrinomonadaceae bacterium]|nr:amino acid adenylation domain-containing protein [Pyrinomonadaceae bacterium]
MSAAKIDISNLTFEQRVFLEQRLKEKRGRAGSRQTIPRRTSSGPAPLSCSQRRLWFLDQLSPGNTSYNATAALRIAGELDIPALESALNEIIRRHEILRTIFPTEEGSPVQIVQSRAFTNLPIHDLTGLSPQISDVKAGQIYADEAKRSFDLASGPLVRASLLRLHPGEHVLLLTLHHIIGDGWSIGVCMRELAALYETYASGQPSSLKELPIQYGDFASWQHQWLQGETFEKQLSYWKQRLKDAPPLLHLPTDRPRRATQSFSGASEQFVLSRTVSEELRSLSRSENVTLFMTLLGAFQTLLFRYTGQRQILTGSPVAGRNWSETEGLIGCFLNLLVLRTDLSGDPTFRELLGRVREVTVGAMAHQDLPFEKLVEELQLERDLSRNPLFQVMFALQNTPQTEMRLADLEMSIQRVESGAAKVDLYLSIDDAEQLTGTVEYNTDLWDASTVKRMMMHFQNLLEDCVANPDRRLSELKLLDQAEHKQLIAGWNETETKYRHERCLHQLFEERVALKSDRVAVSFEGKQLTYDQLNRRANQLAHYLRRLGVAPEQPVGICAQPSIEMLVGLLGVLKAGGAYVPLDPAYPQERLRFMANDARIRVLLTQESLAGQFPESAAEIVFLGHDEIDSECEDNPACPSDPANLAYVIYTSGSSGRPKGVQISHRAVVNFLSSMAKEPGLERDDVLLAVTSLSFDIAGLEIFLPLVVGAQVEIASREVASDGLRLLELLERSGASVMQATPATWRMMLESGWRNADGLKVLCGGEALPADLARQTLDAGCVLWNMYGPTETTIWSTCKKLDHDDGAISIGRPIANTCLYVLDEFQQPVPIGVSGELFIGGDGLARGYLGRAELTAEKFVPNPFDESGGARLYRTGDLVRYLSGGEVEYVARIDHQVKVRGYRIEVAEIEVVLSEHPGVKEAVVTAHEDDNAQKRLVAYFVSDEDLATVELQQYLRTRLPPYMVPSLFVRVEAMPLTPNGKIDRKALPAPDQMRPETGAEYVAPRTPAEEVLAGIWSVLLRVEKVGVHDNFFELGGHSLLATQLVSRVREAFGTEIAVRELFDHPTVAGLAGAIEEMLNAGLGVQALAIVKVSREEELQLSYGQQRLWFLDQLEPGSSAYNMGVAVRLKGTLDVGVVEKSFTEIVRRHESLRTSFGEVDGRPVPFIHETPRFSLPVVDLSVLNEEEREAEARRLANEETHRPFDLLTAPLLRASVLRLSEQEHVLLCTMHHIISDGWSLEVLTRELTTLYEAYAKDEPSPLPELGIQYADYAHWQREWLQGEMLEKQLSYWKQQLAGAPAVLELPADYPRPALQTFRGAHQSLTLSPALTTGLKGVAQREGATLFMTLLAAFQTLLSRYSGQDDIVVGTPIAGRNHAETENLIGFFINTLVLRTDLSRNPCFTELLRRVREVALGAYAHQEVPFEKLVEELQPERDMSRSPLFQVMMILQNTPLADVMKLDGLEATREGGESGTAKFDLMLSVSETSDGQLHTLWEYNTDLFRSQTIARMMDHFEVLLNSVVNNAEQRLSELKLLRDEEQQRILVDWNSTAVEYPRGKCLHQLFEEQVERTPNAVAVVYENTQITYKDLDEKARRPANHLRRLGVGPETLVGLCVERSVEMMVGLLAILKAGGAYVPIDPSYPAQRLSFMLADAQVPVLLTQQHLLASLPEHSARVVCLDAETPMDPDSNAQHNVTADNLAYMIYTSGSTGKPKGAMTTHAAICNRLLWMQDAFELDATDTVLQKTPISFDVSVWELFWPLITGARLVVARPGGHTDNEYLVKLIAEQEVTTVHFVPSMLQAFVEQEPLESCAKLRQVICSGEALGKGLQDRFMERVPWAGLYNLYGPTEAAVDVTYWRCQPESDARSVPIGRPIANTSIYVLDQEMNATPVGVSGELYIGGVGLARGYRGRPELTAERFVPDPHSADLGARQYWTGDVARFRDDGAIEYVGRADNQVKLRGHRIELGEIELALATHDCVAEVAVLLREDEPGGKRLVAYVVTRDGTEMTAGELREHLKGQLPEYMVPSRFVMLAQMPLTPNGKLDRRALPVPDNSRPDLGSNFVAARTPVEEVLTGVWSEVLGLDEVSVNDNFFDIGGHSLLATQITSRLRSIFKIDITVRRLFEHPILADLAQAIESSLRRAEGFVAEPIHPIARDGEMLLSFAQQRLWLMDQVDPGNPSYNLGAALRLKGPLDVAALEASLNEIIRRHEILRTTFPSVEGRPFPVIAEALPLDLCAIDLRDDPGKQQLQQLAAAEAQTPFDLAVGPLLRVRLLRLDAEDHALLLTVHHIAGDGWSVGVLMREFKVLYEAYSTGQESPLPELAIQYIDFAHWQREWLQGEVLERQLTYWKEQLAGAPPLLELPADHPRPAAQSFRGAREKISIGKEVLDQLKQVSREEGVTLFMTLAAAFKTLLWRYSRQDDIVVGTPIANRTTAEVEGLIGFFVNTLVLRTSLRGEPSFKDLLGRVREVALAAYTHQDLPFEKLVEELQIERSLSHNALFQVWFVLQNAPAEDLQLKGLELDQLEFEKVWVRHDLRLDMLESPDGLTGSFEYRTDLFEPHTIRQMARTFETLLAHLATDPEMKIDTLAKLLAETDNLQKIVREQEFISAAHQRLQNIKMKAMNRARLKEVSK